MFVDGDFEFYRFIWDGVQEGWGLSVSQPLYGVRVHFAQGGPNAVDLKQIREHWARFKNKPVSQIKTLVGLSGYVIGKWTKPTAEDICERIVGAGCNAEIEEVPDYSIVNMRTGETAQIRSEEIYDEVIEALIRNGALIDSRQISCACGGFVVDDLSIQRTPGGVTDL